MQNLTKWQLNISTDNQNIYLFNILILFYQTLEKYLICNYDQQIDCIKFKVDYIVYIIDAQIKSFFSQVSQLFIACSAAAPSLHIMINVKANSQRLL